MEGHLLLNTDQTDPSSTVTVHIPATAAVPNHSSCNITDSTNGNATSQVLVLVWSDPDPDFPEKGLAALYIRPVRSHHTGGDLHTRAYPRVYQT